MSQDDPFAEPERTVIRPSPGGRRAAPPPQAPPVETPAFLAEPAPNIDVTHGALNPLIAAATPILSLLVRLRGAISPPNVEALRERIAGELRSSAIALAPPTCRSRRSAPAPTRSAR